MKRKFKVFFAVVVAIMTSCNQTKEITVTNPSSFDRPVTMVELSADRLPQLPSGKAYCVRNTVGEIVPSQLTYDGKLIFQAEIKSRETQTYKVSLASPREYPAKTYGRFIPERKDDFAWENDRVAFRIYGHALIATDGPSNGLDLWYKRTSELVIDRWYAAELQDGLSYHEDHGEGMDAYSVGRSLGGGAMAPFIRDTLTNRDSLILNENFVRREELENGPLRTSFRLYYNDITVNNVKMSETRTFSIDAGSQLTRITQEYGVSSPMTVAAGIVKRAQQPEDAAQATRSQNGTGIIIYEEPETPQTGKVFVGLVFPAGIEKDISHSYTIFNPVKKIYATYSHVLGVATYTPGRPLTYYAGYGWEKFGFPTLASFQNYLGYIALTIEEPLIINYL